MHARWTNDEEKALIRLWAENFDRLGSKDAQKAWDNIAETMNEILIWSTSVLQSVIIDIFLPPSATPKSLTQVFAFLLRFRISVVFFYSAKLLTFPKCDPYLSHPFFIRSYPQTFLRRNRRRRAPSKRVGDCKLFTAHRLGNPGP